MFPRSHIRFAQALGLILAILWICAGAAPASADAKGEARKLFKEGNRLNARGDHRGALNKYIKARKLYPSYKIDLNIAATLYSLGRLTHAVIYYERFLERAGEGAEHHAVETARAKLRELRRRLASLTVSCSEQGARVTVDGRLVGRTPLPRRVYLRPGVRRVLVEKGDRVLLSRDLKLGRGSHRDLVITGRGSGRSPLNNEDVPPNKLISPFEAVPLDVTISPFEDPEGADVQRRQRKTVLAWAFLGMGLATGAVAGVLYGLGVSQGAGAHDAYMEARDPDEIRQRWGEVETAQTKVVAGHVLAGVTALAVGLAIYQFASRPSPPQSATAPAGLGASLGPTPGASGATLWLRGSF